MCSVKYKIESSHSQNIEQSHSISTTNNTILIVLKILQIMSDG
jgi:hypothetical protein